MLTLRSIGAALAVAGLLVHVTATGQEQGAPIPPPDAWSVVEGPGARYTTDAAWADRFEPDLARTGGAASDMLYVVSLEFDSAASRQRLRVPGVTVLTSIDQFADVFVRAMPDGEIDRTALEGIFQTPGLRWLDPITPVSVPPPAVPGRGERTRALPEPIVQGGVAGLTGKGVIVAVIDTGIDFRNPDFITTDESGQPVSRLLYFWDTYDESFDRGRGGSKAPYSYPSGRSMGTVYTRAQLTAELRTRGESIGTTDGDGHGTAAAGVAAGNGKGSQGQHTGVAPEADIIGVRIGNEDGLTNGWLLNAIVGWIDAMATATSQPVVISCSFGGQYGPHDGSRVEERQLDARFADSVSGRAIVISAGNSQREPFHSRRQATGSRRALFVWRAGDRGSFLSLYVRGAQGAPLEPQSVRVVSASAPGVTAVDTSRANMFRSGITQDLVIRQPLDPGVGGLFVSSEADVALEIDAFLVPGTAAFDLPFRTADRLVGTPGTARQAITVGSYDWNDRFSYGGESLTFVDTCSSPMTIGQLSCYSSPGYIDRDAVKPEIVAPGQWYSAPHAKSASGGPLDTYAYVDSTGAYRLFNGTSAAAPYTAGIVALMFQKNPRLTVGEVKSLLRDHASRDAFTGAVPNARWGYGKLDMTAVQAILAGVGSGRVR